MFIPIKKVVSLVFVSVLLSMAVAVGFVRQAVAGGTIYIRQDGTIDPATVPIQRVGNVYTFTGNIYDWIVVERSNIIIDGAGYTLLGTGSGLYGFSLSGITNVTIRNTNIKNFFHGISLASSNITISGNNITNNWEGIHLMVCSNNSISGNNITNNLDYGIALLLDSNNNSVAENNITANRWGILLDISSNNTITGNNIIANTNYGISLSFSSHNSVSENNIANNGYGIGTWAGVGLSESSNNTFYHNNFIDNTKQVYDYSWNYPIFSSSVNVWDDGFPSGGNYWSDYTGVDANGDGIGDTAYVIDANNRDRYPLVFPLVWDYSNPIPVVWAGAIYPVALSSNSTISGFRFDQLQKQISFNLTGSLGATGYCNVIIPKALLGGSVWIITINEVPKTDYTKTENGTHTFLYFTYTHASTSHVIIQGTEVIPEFRIWASMLIILIVFTAAITIYKGKLLKTSIH